MRPPVPAVKEGSRDKAPIIATAVHRCEQNVPSRLTGSSIGLCKFNEAIDDIPHIHPLSRRTASAQLAAAHGLNASISLDFRGWEGLGD